MDEFDFSIISLNVRGLREYKKNRKINNWLIKHGSRNGIVFLQETHSQKDIENEWSKRTRGQLIMSHGETNSRGTAILFGSDLNYVLKEENIHDHGRYVIILAEIQGNNFLLINSYLPNVEKDQIFIMKEIMQKVSSIDIPIDTYIIWGGDFNFCFDIELEAYGGNPVKKVKSIETIESIMQEYDLCDIWRLRNPRVKRYTWRGSGQGKSSKYGQFLQRRLDFFLVSDEIQPFVEKCDIVPAPSTDHSAIMIKFRSYNQGKKGPSFWKFNNSLLENEEYITEITQTITEYKNELDVCNITNPQLRWELLKYEIRKFSIYFSKKLARERRSRYTDIETEIIRIEQQNRWQENADLVDKHDQLLKDLEQQHNYITEGIIIRSKTIWYELGEKNNKYFLTLEKRNKAKTHIKKLIGNDDDEITDPRKIMLAVEEHFNKFFTPKSYKTEEECFEFLENYPVPKVSESDKKICDQLVTVKECFEALRQMGNSKTPGNDGLTKEFYIYFWSALKDDLVSCLNTNLACGMLTNTQKQIIITLLEKQGKDNRYLENWRPISLINVDIKICSRVMSNRLSKILPYIVHQNQSGFVRGRTIEEPLFIIQSIMDQVKLDGKSLLLFAADFEKAFDSIEQNFIFAVLKHFNFGDIFIKWIRLLLNDNLSCIVNNGTATNFFKVGRGTKQGDPISPYLFILVIEIMATMMRKSEEIKGYQTKTTQVKLEIFADDTTFFLQDENSFRRVLENLDMFYKYSSLRINVKKSEVGWLGKKGKEDFIKKTGIKYIDFEQNGIKILGIFFSYKRKLCDQNNIDRVVTNFKTVLSIWKSRSLTLYGKILVLRALALPKLYYIFSKMSIKEEIVKTIESTIKDFIWNGRKPKIKKDTLIGDYSEGGLKLPDFSVTLKANRIKWILRLIQSFKEKKTYASLCSVFVEECGGIENIGTNFNAQRIPKNIPDFFRQNLLTWAEYTSSSKVDTIQTVLNQPIWNNKYILINDKSIFYRNFSTKNINKIGDMCNRNGEFEWMYVKDKGLQDKDFLRWAGIIHAIPKDWKKIIKQHQSEVEKNLNNNAENSFLLGHKMVKIEKVTTRQIYEDMIKTKFKPPTSQTNIEKRIVNEDGIILDWTKIYTRIYTTTIDSYLRMFQYKILNNFLYLNYDLNRFKIIDHSSCSLCHTSPETIDHLFVECIEARNYYFEIRNWLGNYGISLPNSNKKNIILGVDKITINFVILLFKYLLYKQREKEKPPSLQQFKNVLRQYEFIERKVAINKNKTLIHNKKWEKIIEALME